MPRTQAEAIPHRVVNSVDDDYEVELTQTGPVLGVEWPAGSKLVFHGEALVSAMIPSPTSILRHTFPSGTKLQFASGGYYVGTRLSSAELGGRDSPGLERGDVVTLDEGGRIRTARLSSARKIDGAALLAGDLVTFDDAGRVRSRKSKEEVEADTRRSREAEERARHERNLRCSLKCVGNVSCFDHCKQYGY